MAAKVVSQHKFAKLVASTGALAQPPGAITRASNLLFTTRGSLQIADGSLSIGQVAANSLIACLAAFANLQVSQYPWYVALAYPTTPYLINVTGFTAAPVVGSNNAAGTYTFAIAATYGAGHTAAQTVSFTVGATFSGVFFAWSAVTNATGYNIYYVFNTGSGPFLRTNYVLIQSVGPSTNYTFTGVLPVSPTLATNPIQNTTYSIQLYSGYPVVSGFGYAITFTAITVGLFPFAGVQPSFPSGVVPLPANIAPGAPAFALQILPGFSPYGGVSFVVGPLPQIIQFAAQDILILGNGYAPQSVNPTLGASASVTPLANTFNAAYPAWQPSVDWLTGSQVTDGAGNYFTATQGGVSQTPGPPSWNTDLGSETSDGSVIWTSQGPIISGVDPRGAAHAVSYAGSLWLANTSPADTSDGIDGPSCIKMSDSNNPNSWNPVNTAFIGRNDGTQITGLQPFTIAALGISPTGSLCVFKEFTTYQVIGVFGSTSFEIQPAQTSLGCIAARSIQFIPGFGVVRFSHLGFAVFDGINDRLISEDIRPYLFGGVDSEADLTPVDPQFVYLSQSAQTVSPPMYICAIPLTAPGLIVGQITRLFCYDLVMKSWAVLDLPWTITSLSTLSTGEGYPLVIAGKSDGTLQRMQSADTTWDAGASDQSNVNWSFRTPDVFGEGSSQRLFYQQAVIRGYGSAAMVQSIIATLWIDGVNVGSQGIDIVPMGGPNLFEANVKIWANGKRAHLDISGNNGGAAGTIDAVDWTVVPKSSQARRVIS
ncbi:MAG: hypothetical protein WBE72_10285 [Terracidiphilus sp.]